MQKLKCITNIHRMTMLINKHLVKNNTLFI